jgi:hypothetical protein
LGRSVAKQLSSSTLCFGGSALTLTDVAIFAGTVEIAGASADRIDLDISKAAAVFAEVKTMLSIQIAKMRGEYKNFPVIFVGGGAALLPSTFFSENDQQPQFFDVANAYGAALSEISGTVDTVVSLQQREKTLAKLYADAKQNALDRGARSDTLRLIEQQIIPYSYVPNQMARVIIRYSGKQTQLSPSR